MKIMERIRSTMMSYDLSIAAVQSEIDCNLVTIKRYKGLKNNSRGVEYTKAILENEELGLCLEELKSKRDEYIEKVKSIVGFYIPICKSGEMFLGFVQGKKTREIAKSCGLDESEVSAFNDILTDMFKYQMRKRINGKMVD